MSLTLTNTPGSDFKPHPEGIFHAVCVDVMDLGLMETSFQGVKRLQPKIKIVFETEALTEKAVRCTVSRSVTASLNPKATLAQMLSKWRGRPIGEGETVPLEKLVGACCTLVISHQKSADGTKTYANIDAISKPTKKVAPSGAYNPADARKRFAEWKAKQQAGAVGSSQQPSSALRAPSPAPAGEGFDDGDGSDLGPVAPASNSFPPQPSSGLRPPSPAPAGEGQAAAAAESVDVPF